jgi:quinol monooxygenase YgiN
MVVLVGSLLLVAFLYAQTKGEQITVVSHVDIIPDAYKAGAEESAARLFRAESAASEKDGGLVWYAVFQEIGAPNHFTIVETWHDAMDSRLAKRVRPS